MKLPVFIFLLILTIFWDVQAGDFSSLMKENYLLTDKNFDIDCRYAFNKTFKLLTPISETVKGNTYIQRDFKVETESKTINMSFVLNSVSGKNSYTIVFDQKYRSESKLTKREFYISPVNDVNFAREFETSQIVCGVNFAYAYPFTLNDGEYHINVHPHKIYDWQSLLKTQIENYLSNDRYRSLILLETGNYRGNLVNIQDFLNNIDYRLPQVNYASDLDQIPEMPLIVSPAGHNRYFFQASNELTITFTGGNHNYCIWNNTREVLESFMRSKSNAKVTIYYDSYSIIAQAKGIEGFRFNFPRREINQSNLLKNLLANSKTALNYHSNYHRYFKDSFFREFMGMFKSIRLSYQAVGFNQTNIIQGQGNRKLEISLIYLE